MYFVIDGRLPSLNEYVYAEQLGINTQYYLDKGIKVVENKICN